MSAFDRQVGGDHYKSCKIQPLEYALANDLGVIEHAIVKYATRWEKKGGIQDIDKIIHYAELLKEHALHREPEEEPYPKKTTLIGSPSISEQMLATATNEG